MTKPKFIKVSYIIAKILTVIVFIIIGIRHIPMCFMFDCSGSGLRMFGWGGLGVATYLLFLKVIHVSRLLRWGLPVDFETEFRKIYILGIIIFPLFSIFYLFFYNE